MSKLSMAEMWDEILMTANGDPFGCLKFRHMLESFEKQATDGNLLAFQACRCVDQFYRMLKFASDHEPLKTEKK